jgi:hypothetical protein
MPTGVVPGTRIGGKYEVVEVDRLRRDGRRPQGARAVGSVSPIRALKTILPPQAAHPSILTRFREEAEKLCLLEHENIVPVLAYGEEGDFPYGSPPDEAPSDGASVVPDVRQAANGSATKTV